MNLLIIGGLLGFALVAILVAVLLGMSEQRAEKTRAHNAPATSTVAAAALPEMSNASTPGYPALSPAAGKSALVDAEEQMLPALNGQFREFASELRSLHQQAWELEQHLRGMTEMVSRIESARANQVNIEEETRTHSQAHNL